MDTNMIKRVGLITLGGVAGGVIGYFLAGLVIDQIEKRRKDAEQEAEWKEEWLRDSDPAEVTEGEDDAVLRDYTKFAREKGELSELVKPYTSSISEKPKKSKVQDKEDNIRIISLDEYETTRSTNKEPVAYYAEDTTFANAQEEIIDDPNSLFGANIHLHFGEQSEDPDIVYVRNENNGVDYEITRIPNSYSIVVMGMPEGTPKEKAKRRRNNTKKVTTHEDEDSEEEEG